MCVSMCVCVHVHAHMCAWVLYVCMSCLPVMGLHRDAEFPEFNYCDNMYSESQYGMHVSTVNIIYLCGINRNFSENCIDHETVNVFCK